MSVIRRSRSIVLIGLLVAVTAALVATAAISFARAGEHSAAVADPRPAEHGDALVGHVVAAYVAPNELVFASAAGGPQQSLPVAGDVTVTKADGNAGSYDELTLADTENRSYELTITDGWVTAIVERR